MAKFKFKTASKNKINFIKNSEEYISDEIFLGSHIEFFSNRRIVVEGCKGIVEYDENYLKIKIDNMFVNFFGSDFLITEYDNKKIMIKGKLISVEFNNR